MSTRLTGPDSQTVADNLTRRIPGYVPELSAALAEPGRALTEVVARYLELLESGLAQVPNRSFLAFLGMMGTHLLPAQAARAPLVFSLIDGSPVDVTLPERSQVAATPAPPAPSLLPASDPTGQSTDPIVFATDQAVTLSRGKLATLHSIVPGTDQFADHCRRLSSGFVLFDQLEPTEHAIYLGHDQLFALAGDITVLLSFSLEAGAGLGLVTQWEYLTESGWLPLVSLPEDDTTGGLRGDGQIAVRRACGPNAKKETFAGRTSFWLRGRLMTPLLPQEVTGRPPLPIINDIRASVLFSESNLLPEAAFADGVKLDTTKVFRPFGPRPAQYGTFYLASKEVFQRKRARVRLEVTLADAIAVDNGTVNLEWEFHDGSRWQTLGVEGDLDVKKLAATGAISFLCPPDWAETNVNGVNSYWLRVRIVKGDYGHPLGVTVTTVNNLTQITPVKDTLKPPVISRLTLGYAYVTDPEPLDHCLAHNDFVFEDQTEACLWPDQTFTPFRLVADRESAVHFGFDRQLPVGLVSIYVDVPPTSADALPDSSSPFIWEYRSARGWTELGVLDETVGFQRSGMLQFVGPPDAIAADGLGDRLFRVRARLKQGEQAPPLPIGGIWLNAVWATHSQTLDHESLGSSDGNPGQTFFARRSPVLAGETLEVQEWTGRGEYWRTFVRNVAPGDLRFERDPATGEVTAVWVRWSARPHLYDSSASDRHYLIERARSQVSFGDGRHGAIPPAGRQLSLSYRSGGGLAGNLPAGAISQLRTAVPFIMGATNPVSARGGAAIESLNAVRARGAQRLRHRERAVSLEDIEWVAHDASPEVARARCRPLTGLDGHAQRGWMTLVIVPHSADSQPSPTVALRGRVREHLAARLPATVIRQFGVEAPTYALVSIAAELVPAPAQSAALLEARVRDRLDRFLHPLTGGTEQQGWNFGETVHLSQIASVIRGTEGVALIRELGLSVDGKIYGESIPVAPDMLIAPGAHELKLVLGGE